MKWYNWLGLAMLALLPLTSLACLFKAMCEDDPANVVGGLALAAILVGGAVLLLWGSP